MALNNTEMQDAARNKKKLVPFPQKQMAADFFG